MKSFRQYLIEGGKLNARWSNWLNSVNTEHPRPGRTWNMSIAAMHGIEYYPFRKHPGVREV